MELESVLLLTSLFDDIARSRDANVAAGQPEAGEPGAGDQPQAANAGDDASQEPPDA